MTNAIVLIENEEFGVPCCVKTMLFTVFPGGPGRANPNKTSQDRRNAQATSWGIARAKRIKILNLIYVNLILLYSSYILY